MQLQVVTPVTGSPAPDYNATNNSNKKQHHF